MDEIDTNVIMRHYHDIAKEDNLNNAIAAFKKLTPEEKSKFTFEILEHLL